MNPKFNKKYTMLFEEFLELDANFPDYFQKIQQELNHELRGQGIDVDYKKDNDLLDVNIDFGEGTRDGSDDENIVAVKINWNSETKEYTAKQVLNNNGNITEKESLVTKNEVGELIKFITDFMLDAEDHAGTE